MVGTVAVITVAAGLCGRVTAFRNRAPTPHAHGCEPHTQACTAYQLTVGSTVHPEGRMCTPFFRHLICTSAEMRALCLGGSRTWSPVPAECHV
jgi:hypothetical protein